MPGKTNPKAKVRKKRGKAGGRSKIDITSAKALDLFYDLNRIQCTNEEIAAIFKCSEQTVRNWLKTDKLAKLAAAGRADGMQSLRRSLIHAALDGDSRVLVHVSKSMLKNVEVSKLIDDKGKTVEFTFGNAKAPPDHGNKV